MKHVPSAPAITTWEGADAALAAIREADGLVQAAESVKNRELAELQERHDTAIIPLIEKRDIQAKALADFAEAHRDEFAEARSRTLNNGIIGFRLGNPTLEPLPKRNWKKVLQHLIEAGDKWIRVKKDVDREALLRSGLSADELRAIGVLIVQEERFYYETRSAETVSPK